MPQNTSTSTTKIMHINNGHCPKCVLLFNKYQGFHEGLRLWFIDLQNRHPDAHISCAGRGEELQNTYFDRGRTRAKYGESAHNYNMALDLFRLVHGGMASFDSNWFKTIIYDEVTRFNKEDVHHDFKLLWYGFPNAPYYELPHIEVLGWRTMTTTLVEPMA